MTPTRSFIEEYCALTGRREIEDFGVYVAFCFFRMAAILQGVKRRALDGNASDPERGLKLGALVPRYAEAGWRRWMDDLDPTLREGAYPLQAHLGSSLTGWREGWARVELPVADVLGNRQGLVHGGVHATLLDTAMGYCGCYTGDPIGVPWR
jgi:hypothetical protein